MPKYLELQGEIVIDITSLLGQVKKPEPKKEKKEKEEKDE